MILSVVSYLFLILMIFVSVGFIVTLERKILGYIQLRKGPNKVGYMGLLQPLGDGLKLFFSEHMILTLYNFYIYFFSPVFMIMISFFIWCLFPYMFNMFLFNYGMLFFLCCLGLGVYGLMFTGWSSNSNYSLLGSIRSVAQTISYEVSLALIMICIFMFTFSFNLIDLFMYQCNVWFLFFSFPLFSCWLSTCLAETNRTPFDLSEGESELVSGFNIEYSSGGFVLIFMSEYMNIVFMCMMTSFMYLGCDINNMSFYFSVIVLLFWFIWIRGTLPRIRYDMLMNLTWSKFLPFVLNYFMFIVFFILILTTL
uniref:NADH-ubiquinone oxidoreductase chain 1 n=1 Tax=Cantacader sp. TaxID=2931283 RepID=A0A8T9ZYJ4_9HEMI|nr:NADH dehydrogenase subunit 1 [Cantacader sp.]